MATKKAPRIRPVDPVKLRTALTAEWRAAAAYAAALTPEQLDAPSGLTGWSTADLVAHIALGVTSVTRWTAEPPQAGALITVGQWADGTAAKAAAISADVKQAGADGINLAAALEESVQKLTERADDAPVFTRIGPMRFTDMLITRLIEVVVHADDLERAVGAPFPHDRQALATVVKVLADVLAVRAPGGSVEVRIPPFAVVQCIEGPKHTRGTPPNVVETTPKTWLRLAAGRLSWAEALENAEVSASGERADLAGNLPLLG